MTPVEGGEACPLQFAGNNKSMLIFETYESKTIVIEKNDKSAQTLWGKVVLALRQSKYPALHTACGDIRDVVLNDNILKINTDIEYIHNIIMKPENYKVLTDILKGINASLVFQVNLLENKNIEIEKNIQKLKSKFGDNLKIE